MYSFIQCVSVRQSYFNEDEGREYGFNLSETNNRLEFAESLARQHPDVATVTKKFGRWHHQVNYKTFKRNSLILKENIDVPPGVNEYGMIKKELTK